MCGGGRIGFNQGRDEDAPTLTPLRGDGGP